MNGEYQTINLVMLVGDNPEANYINHIDSPSLLPETIMLDISKPVIRGYEFLDTFKKDPETMQGSKIIVMSNSLNAHEIDAMLKRPSVAGYVNKLLLVEKLKILKSSYLKAPNKKQRIN